MVLICISLMTWKVKHLLMFATHVSLLVKCFIRGLQRDRTNRIDIDIWGDLIGELAHVIIETKTFHYKAFVSQWPWNVNSMAQSHVCRPQNQGRYMYNNLEMEDLRTHQLARTHLVGELGSDLNLEWKGQKPGLLLSTRRRREYPRSTLAFPVLLPVDLQLVVWCLHLAVEGTSYLMYSYSSPLETSHRHN